VSRFARRIREEQQLADQLAPTQQLVRPLLMILPAASTSDDGSAVDIESGKDL
jgi:hypothetical protein